MNILKTLVMIGPGRRSDRTVLDQLLEFESADLEQLGKDTSAIRSRLLDMLHASGLVFAEDNFHAAADPDPVLILGCWYVETALLLQQSAGHRVAFSECLKELDPNTVRAVIEFEESSVGTEAAALARELIMHSIAPDASDTGAGIIVAKVESFRAMARELVLPLDSEALIAAAKAFDVPCFKLDREPYLGLRGEFRIRRNGLLMFGHACNQHIVDGTFCIDRSATVLASANSRLLANKLLRAHGLATPRTDPLHETCVSLRRAERAAHRIGYPVVVKPLVPHRGCVSCNVASRGELQNAVRTAQQVNSTFLVESHIPGNAYRIFCSGQQFQAVVDARTGRDVTERCDASIVECAAGLASQLTVGMLVLGFITTDPGRPLEETGGAFVSLDVMPELDSMLPPGSELYRSMAEGFVEWLFPEGQPCRVPVFAVTGTNGKTTTCRMLAAILEKAGFRVGMACTDGVYLDGRLAEKGDLSGRNGHHRVFESREINAAVLETARGAVLTAGFIFDWCDVAVCTNVTPEHLGEYGIETVEQMGEVKQLVLRRARQAVVLNADDPECRKIGQRLPGQRICWCSLELNAAAISRAGLGAGRFIALQPRDGEDWIIHCHAGMCTYAMPVSDIPATFKGLARHNLLNAMQAMAAALEFGIDLRVVRDAIAGFSMGIDTTPGRSNFHYGLGFPVLMDFVQTIDGMRRFCEFARAVKVDGKRILVISVLGRHNDEIIRGFARFAATAFDYFICRNYGFTFTRPQDEIPNMLRDQLLLDGVPGSAIRIIHNDTEAMDAALGMATEADLVAIMCGHEFQKYWQEISSFRERSEAP